MHYTNTLPLLAAAFAAGTVLADTNPAATPKEFTPESAMLAIFGVYNTQQKGVLVPPRLTREWRIDEAGVLATPLLARIYTESGRELGVLVVERADLLKGQVLDSHAQAPNISVYLFSHKGELWTFERGRREVMQFGSYGHAPAPKLIPLGSDRHGLLFTMAYTGQGYTEEGITIVDLSEQEFAPSAQVTTGEDNGGTCSDDPKEREQTGMDECWSYSARIETVRDGTAPYDLLRVRYEGTRGAPGTEDPSPRPVNRVEFYRKGEKKYEGPLKEGPKDAAATSVLK